MRALHIQRGRHQICGSEIRSGICGELLFPTTRSAATSSSLRPRGGVQRVRGVGGGRGWCGYVTATENHGGRPVGAAVPVQ
jgi:hypothetical protein